MGVGSFGSNVFPLRYNRQIDIHDPIDLRLVLDPDPDPDPDPSRNTKCPPLPPKKRKKKKHNACFPPTRPSDHDFTPWRQKGRLRCLDLVF